MVQFTGHLNDDSFYKASANLTLTVSDACTQIIVPAIPDQVYSFGYLTLASNITIPAFSLVSNDTGCLFTTFTYSLTCQSPTGGNCSGINFDPITLSIDLSLLTMSDPGNYSLSIIAEVDGTSLSAQQDFNLVISAPPIPQSEC